MSLHHARVEWKRTTTDFTYDTYDRTHTVTFGGGTQIKMSSAPEFKGDAALVNPEEQLAAALSSCHMLTFLAIAARSRVLVENYEDAAVATLDKDENGKFCVTQMTLNPKVTFSEPQPSAEKIKQMHEKAHLHCFIAASVKCKIEIRF